jgi:hypothetical protein
MRRVIPGALLALCTASTAHAVDLDETVFITHRALMGGAEPSPSDKLLFKILAPYDFIVNACSDNRGPGQWVFGIISKDSPRWNPLTYPRPPLDPGAAAQIATKYAAKLSTDRRPWQLDSINLRQARTGRAWFYSVRFWPDRDGPTSPCDVVVLLDGSVPDRILHVWEGDEE